MTKAFFTRVTADFYEASANGRDGNPDLNTLVWIVEAAKAQGLLSTLAGPQNTPSAGSNWSSAILRSSFLHAHGAAPRPRRTRARASGR